MTQKLLPLFLFVISFSIQASELKNLDAATVRLIGHKIWQNEGAGKIENLTIWNKGEDFPSFGIGHFIWYPAGIEGPFTESFPQLLDHLKLTTTIPDWLHKSHDAPWPNRDTFYASINSPHTKSLRALMLNTIPQQTTFIIKRMELALQKILQTLPDNHQRTTIENQFYRVANQHNGIYALIDYINFKGEGISEKERYKGKGWGLLQVLANMRLDSNDVMIEFVRAADFVLTRRVKNANRDESRWLKGWRNRLKTYLDAQSKNNS